MPKIFGVVVAGMLIFGARPALALGTGQCLPAQQVRDELRAEGMQPIIVGNRTGYGYPTSLIFFSNLDGSRGYLIRGDRPFPDQADTACVEGVYERIRLNDITRAGTPSWAKLPIDPARVASICRGHLGYQDECGRHDEGLSNLERSGQRVMFMAVGTAINPRDHSVRTGQRVMLTVDPNRAGGLLMAVTPEGANYTLSAYTKASYTQFGSAMLEKAAKQ